MSNIRQVSPILVHGSNDTPLWRQIFAQLRDQIANDLYGAGDILPSIRGLSEALGVSRNTVLAALERLVDEGYVRAHPRVGFVVEGVPDRYLGVSATTTGRDGDTVRHAQRFPPCYGGHGHNLARRRVLPFDFALGRPNLAYFPWRVWNRIMEAKLCMPRWEMAEYMDPAGLYEFRHAVAQHLRTARGIHVGPEQVITVAGIQEGLNLAARVLLPTRGQVVVEDPCYRGAHGLFHSLGARMIPVASTSDGFVGLPARADMAYLTPSHQFPMGHTLDHQARREILDWAADSGAWLLEDDYDSDFRYDGPPLPALTALDRRGCCVYLGTFSKSLGAGLRLGFVVPPPELVAPMVAAKSLLNNGHCWLTQAAMAEFVASGEHARHLRRIRRLYREQRDVLLSSLASHFGPLSVSGNEAGMHLAWHLPRHFPDADECVRRAAEVGVGLYAPDAVAVVSPERAQRRTVLFGYAGLDVHRIRKAVAALSRAFLVSGR